MKQNITPLLLLALLWIVGDEGELEKVRDPNYRTPRQWNAHQESGDFSEYYWRHADTSCGWLDVVTDPTNSGRGYVVESQKGLGTDRRSRAG